MSPGRSITLTEVVFLSQRWAEIHTPQPGEALISITDRHAPPAALREGWPAVLRISFDDVDPIESPLDPGEDLVELTDQEADRIAEFVVCEQHRVRSLVVHCRYGQSRSAGVAKAIAAAYGLDFPADYDYANNFVHDQVLAALRRRRGA